jgi:hypothetical protein
MDHGEVRDLVLAPRAATLRLICNTELTFNSPPKYRFGLTFLRVNASRSASTAG